VQDRVKEHAVLQTIGFSGPRVFRLVLAESVLLSLAGGALGVGVAMIVLQYSGLMVGAEAVTIAFQPTARLALTGLFVALLTGLLAGIAPAWQASRAEIVPALRQT
jgi:putative ABC transport system permease protein